MKSIFRGYHILLMATFLAVSIFAPLTQQAWAGWEHLDPNSIIEMPFSRITALAMDANSLWIGSDQGLVEKQLSFDNPSEGWIVHSDKIDSNYVPISSMYMDQNIVLWLGTPMGLLSYDPDSQDPNNPSIHIGLSFTDPNEIRDIEVDADFVWVATDTGLNRLDKSSGDWVRYSNDPNDPNGFDSSLAWAVESREDDTIWVLPGLPNPLGIYRYTVSSGQWDYFSMAGSVQVDFNSIIMGEGNDIWLGSEISGLWRFLPDSDIWTQWEEAGYELPSNFIQAIGRYPGANRIIVATGNGTDGYRIARYDHDLGLWQPIGIPASLGLNSRIITDILVDPNRNQVNQVWFGTEDGGLYRWREGAIIWSDPANGSENVPLNTDSINVILNECIDPDSIELGAGSSLEFKMLDPDRNPISDPNIYDPNDFNLYFLDPLTNTHLIIEPIDPNYELRPNTWYSFKFTSNITNCSYESILQSDIGLEFKTTITLSVVDTDPDPNAVDVNPYDPIIIWFSSDMDPNSFFPAGLTLQAEGGFPTTIPKSDTDFSEPNRLIIEISGDHPLQLGTRYTFTVNKDIKDIFGNTLGEAFSFQFTTKTAPEIYDDLNSPYSDAIDIPLDTTIDVSFDRPMNKDSVAAAFTLKPDIPGSSAVTCDPNWKNNRVTFTPRTPLTPGIKYSVTIDANARDTDNIPLGNPMTWYFTTISSSELLKTIYPPEGGWPVLHIMGMDPNTLAVTAMALNPKDGGLWAGLSSEDPNGTWKGIGLFHYNGSDWERYTSSYPNGLTSDYINDLAFDGKGNLWIATEPDPYSPEASWAGVNMFDGQAWHWYDPNTFYNAPSGQEAEGFLHVNAIDVYGNGGEDLVWIATRGGIGVGKYNPGSDKWEWSVTTEFYFPSLIAVAPIGGTVWVASEFLMNMDPNEPCNSIVGFDMNKFSEWRFNIWDPNIRVWTPPPDGGPTRMKSPDDKTDSNLRAMAADGFGNLWLGAKNGLYKINIEALLQGECNYEIFDQFETGGGLISGSIYDLVVNPADPSELLVSTDSGISVLKIAESTKSPTSWTLYPITDTVVLTILPSAGGGMFVGTERGLLMIDEAGFPIPQEKEKLTFEGRGCFIESL